MNKIKIIGLMSCLLLVVSCKFYSLSGISIPEGTRSFQVNYFQNNAPLVEPGIERTFTFALADLIQNQSSLTLATDGGDLIYEGEIVDYYIAPQTATSDNVAAQNRLTVAVSVRFINTKVEDGSKDFTKRYSFFVDRSASTQFVGAALDDALAEIYERITQDIFNDSLADW